MYIQKKSQKLTNKYIKKCSRSYKINTFRANTYSWLEDIFILEQYRGNGIGKFAMRKLDELMVEKKVVAMFVDVIPRNTSAIKLYRECGFDHLNLIQLRKNYDKKIR